MSSFSDDLSERFLAFSVGIMKLDKHLCKSYSGRHVYQQLFRAGTSTGSNYEEARAGESRADFIHKMQIVLKELREAHFWLNLVCAANMIPSEAEILKSLNSESQELSKIIAKSVLTAKSKINQKKSPDA
jgi:four helix bundle protein